jgi:hypothetical protein
MLLLVAGFSMSCDRRGLRAEYWANTADWAGLPVFERVERSVPMTPKRVGAVVRARVFSVRWRQTQPDLGQRTRMDPSGLVGLIRPDSLEYLSGD